MKSRSNPSPMAMAQHITEGFGAQVRRLRQARGMTQRELGNAAYLTVDHIGKIERGSTSPKIETLGRLAAGLQVPIGHLFSPHGDAPKAELPDPLVELVDYLRQHTPEDAAFALTILRKVFDYHAQKGVGRERSQSHGQP